MFNIEQLSFTYNKEKILKDINMKVEKGTFIGIVGPNGSGKTTLLKNMYRALEYPKGHIYFEGKELKKMRYKDSAKGMSVVTQEHEVAFDFTTKEIVAMGLYPNKGLLDRVTQEEEIRMQETMQVLHIEDLQNRNYQTLSGGEKQRVMIARAIVQCADFLVLDEPTNHLDISHCLSIFNWLKSKNKTVIASIHDINLALMYCDKIVLMKQGKVYQQGTIEEVITKDNIKDVYDVDVDIIKHPQTNQLMVVYLR